ncbi:MAG: transposase [Clostridia bacterium]|jgi:transposase|nr:transposase [Clostridia bacterium]
MKTHYDTDFKKELVREYIDGKSLNDLYQTYGVAKSTIAGWVKKYSEECQYIKPQNKNNNNSNEEIRALNKKIKELEKENDFLKKAAAFFAKGID